MNMQDDPEKLRSQGIDHRERKMRLPLVQYPARGGNMDLSSMVENAAATSASLQAAVVAVEPTKIDTDDSVSRTKM